MHPEIQSLVAQIRDDTEHGASELARRALKVLEKSIEVSKTADITAFIGEQQQVASALMSTRPSMVAVRNAVYQAIKEIPAVQDLKAIKTYLISKIEGLVSSSEQAVSRIASLANELILKPGDRIFTHSYSSTVVAALEKAAARLSFKVFVTRSGAGNSGLRTVRNLTGAGIPVVYLDDTAAGLYCRQSDKVILGADRICADGSLINGIGTYQVALIAWHNGIPVYVLCENLKIDCEHNGEDVHLEEKNPAEVLKPGLVQGSITVKNPYFDLTPLKFITGILTENGWVEQRDVLSYIHQIC